MSIKITPLTESIPNCGFDTNERKTFGLLHAGRDYYEVCLLLQQAYKQGILLPSACVEFPLMHQCIELLAKALATKVDTKTPPKHYNHGTLKLMRRYEQQISVFSLILADSEKCNLIEQLEKGYLLSRYGESSYYSEFKIYEIFNDIAEELMDAYHDLTGLPFLGKHFPVKKT